MQRFASTKLNLHAQEFVSGLTDIPEAARAALAQLTPATYVGNAAQQVADDALHTTLLLALTVQLVDASVLDMRATNLGHSDNVNSCAETMTVGLLDMQARALPQQLQQLARKQR